MAGKYPTDRVDICKLPKRPNLVILSFSDLSLSLSFSLSLSLYTYPFCFVIREYLREQRVLGIPNRAQCRFEI